jgi:hypothetical protein
MAGGDTGVPRQMAGLETGAPRGAAAPCNIELLVARFFCNIASSRGLIPFRHALRPHSGKKRRGAGVMYTTPCSKREPTAQTHASPSSTPKAGHDTHGQIVGLSFLADTLFAPSDSTCTFNSYQSIGADVKNYFTL